MSCKEAFHVAKQLCEFGCPTDILGCDPLNMTDEEKSNIENYFSNLLFRPSRERNELLKWVDSKIFDTAKENSHDYIGQEYVTADATSLIIERLSCITSDTSDGFFGMATQVHIRTNLYHKIG